jgi:hypothetical protein
VTQINVVQTLSATEQRLLALGEDTTWSEDQIEVRLQLNKDCLGKVTKHKLRLVVQGLLQREVVDYGASGKGTTFCLMLALKKAKKLNLHQRDVDSAFPYADLLLCKQLKNVINFQNICSL